MCIVYINYWLFRTKCIRWRNKVNSWSHDPFQYLVLFTCSCRISALNHEVLDDAMKLGVIVITSPGQLSKVFTGFVSMFPIQLHSNRAHSEKRQNQNKAVKLLQQMHLLLFKSFRGVHVKIKKPQSNSNVMNDICNQNEKLTFTLKKQWIH